MSHKVIGVFDKHFEDRPMMTIFASKLAYGVHRVILLRAGQKMSLKTYTKCILLADLVWFVVIVSIAVVFSATIGPIMKGWLKYIEILVLIVIVGFVLLEKILAKISEKFLE
jgi:membrane protein DedA with SNARE-associated domain